MANLELLNELLVTPFATFEHEESSVLVPVTVACLYVVVILTMNRVMTTPVACQSLFLLHNLFLSALSLVMLLGLTLSVLSHYTGDVFPLFCDSRRVMAKGALWYWLNLFYLSKYYEFLDTVFLVVKRKPLTFLHVFHHCSTVVVVFLGLNGFASYTWIAAWQNCLVHTLMYFYYAAKALGYDPWWKRALTVLQMCQFWLNMLGLGMFAVLRWRGIDCNGDWLSWGGSLSINLLFYVLFQLFFNKTYKRKQQ